MNLQLTLDNRRNGGAILESLARPLKLFPDGIGGMLVSQPTPERIKHAIGLRGNHEAKVGQKNGTVAVKVDGAVMALKAGPKPGTAQVLVKLDPEVIDPQWYMTWVKVNLAKRLQAMQAFEAIRLIEQAV